MLKDQADGAAVLPPPVLSAVLRESRARYPGSAHNARMRHAAPHGVAAGKVPAQIRRDGTQWHTTNRRLRSSARATGT